MKQTTSVQKVIASNCVYSVTSYRNIYELTHKVYNVFIPHTWAPYNYYSVYSLFNELFSYRLRTIALPWIRPTIQPPN
jgi:hypothetical protein